MGQKTISVKETFQYLADNRSKMSVNQIVLITSFEKYFKKWKVLSERQIEILLSIKNGL